MEEKKLERIKPSEVRKVVFNGGGAKGAAHPVAFAALLACGVKEENIDSVAGASAGSLQGVLVALAYNVNESHEIMKNLNFLEFFDEDGFNTRKKVTKTMNKVQQGKPKPVALLPALSKAVTMKIRIANNGGIYRGETLRKFVEEKIYAKTGIEYCTFSELHELRNENKTFKDLYVMVTNINTRVKRSIGHIKSGNVIISDAVRASIAHPPTFEPHKIHIKENGKRISESDDLYFDGGVSANYPIDQYDKQPNGDVIFNREVVGLYLCSSEKAKYLRGESDELPRHKIKSGFLNNAMQSLDIAKGTQYSNFINTPKDVVRTIPIDNMGVKTLDFNLKEDPKKYNELLESGWNAPCQYFNQQHDFPEKYKIAEGDNLQNC